LLQPPKRIWNPDLRHSSQAKPKDVSSFYSGKEVDIATYILRQDLQPKDFSPFEPVTQLTPLPGINNQRWQ